MRFRLAVALGIVRSVLGAQHPVAIELSRIVKDANESAETSGR